MGPRCPLQGELLMQPIGYVDCVLTGDVCQLLFQPSASLVPSAQTVLPPHPPKKWVFQNLTLLFQFSVPMEHDEFLVAPILIRAPLAITHCSPLVYTNNAIFYLEWNPFGSCCSWHLKCLPPVENLQGADIISIADECVIELGPTKTIRRDWVELHPSPWAVS